MANKGLRAAKREKNDEFYTIYSDVEKELQHYTQHFNGKIVYCNCDTTSSAFWKYFYNNFESLGLKKLISTYYSQNFNAYKTEYIGGEESREKLNWNGDFRSQECQRLLEECDIVCTNPPFSLFREYLTKLIDSEKKFLIIGNKNSLTYKEVFPLIKENKVWLGFNSPKEFDTPNGITKKVNGLTRWFTNLDIQKRHEELMLWKEYSAEEFPKFDNYEAINIDKTAEIPKDYYGVMGVPTTFLDRYNPDQFELIGVFNGYKPETADIEAGQIYGEAVPVSSIKSLFRGPAVNGKAKYIRILIKRKEERK